MAAALLAAVPTTLVPTRAMAGVTNTAHCAGEMTLTFTPALTALPATPGFDVTGGGTCMRLSDNAMLPISWSASGVATIDATCEDILAEAQSSTATTMTFPSGNTVQVSMAFGGPTAAMAWAAVGPPLTVAASGVFSMSAADIENCIKNTATTIAMAGTFVVVE